MKGKHVTQTGGLNSASQKNLKTLVEISISSKKTLFKLIWADHPKHSETKIFQILLELWLGTLFVFSWLFMWIIDSTDNLMHRIMFFVSNFFSFQHGRKRDVKLSAGFIRHAIYFVAYTANITSLLIGWLTDW